MIVHELIKSVSLNKNWICFFVWGTCGLWTFKDCSNKRYS